MRLRIKKRKTDACQDPEATSNHVINHWARLPNEVFVSILRFSPQKDHVYIFLINKKSRDVCRDSRLWTKFILGFKDLKQSAISCSKLIDRCETLTSLKITNKSLNLRSLNPKSVVIRAKKSLKSPMVDGSICRLSEVAFRKLGQIKDLISIKLTLATNSHNPFQKVKLLSNLDQLKELRVYVRWPIGDGRPMGTAVWFQRQSEALYPDKKLRKVDLLYLIQEKWISRSRQQTYQLWMALQVTTQIQELCLHFRKNRPGLWEKVNEDGDNLHQFITENPEIK